MGVFAVGQRVITKDEQPIYPEMTGYYGHVVAIDHRAFDVDHGQLLAIQFRGRVGGKVNLVYLRALWPCWADEVDAVD